MSKKKPEVLAVSRGNRRLVDMFNSLTDEEQQEISLIFNQEMTKISKLIWDGIKEEEK